MTPCNVGDDFDLAEYVYLVPVGAVKQLQRSGSVEGNIAFPLVFVKDLRPGAAEVGGKPNPRHFCAVTHKEGIPGAKI